MIHSAEIAGHLRHFGCNRRTALPGRLFRTFNEAIPIIPQADLHDSSDTHLAWDLLDQNGYGACVGACEVLIIETLREMAGLPRVKLSWGHAYGLINRGRDQGATLAHAMHAALTIGVCDTSCVEADNWHAADWPPDWRDNARQYRITECWDCPTLPHALTAAFRHTPVVAGIPVYRNFEPDADGYLPEPNGPIRGYHAVPLLGIHFRRSKLYIPSKNSWGPWGLHATGFFYIPLSYFSAPVADAWAPRVTTYAKKAA